MTAPFAELLINGQWRPAADRQTEFSIGPASQDRIGSYASAGIEDVNEAIAAARDAFERPDWAHSPRLRQKVLLAWADRLEHRGDTLAQLLTAENGKVAAQARGEIAAAVSDVRFYAGLARYIPGHVLETEPGVYSTVLKEPAGVAALIIPWNAPVKLLTRALTPALAAGCTVVIKSAPQAAQVIAAAVRELHAVAELPKGVVNLVSEIGHATAKALVVSADVDVLSFTGSSKVGIEIMAAAAPTLKKLSLELGGKSCCVVFEDADIDRIAGPIAAAAIIISGQQCTAARRVLVHASRYDEMKRALKLAFENIVVGPGNRPGVQMGPLIDAAALARVCGRIDEAVERCDEVILRGRRLVGELASGLFLTPTLVAHSDSSAFFCQEEIFGPFVVLEKFADEREAVTRANHTEFGLSASVWTNDGSRAMRVARALRDGTVWINDHNKLFTEAETGGYRRSGLGRLHGFAAINDFVETKHIYQNVGVA